MVAGETLYSASHSNNGNAGSNISSVGNIAFGPLAVEQMKLDMRNQVSARGVPDVAWNAAVNGGVLVYESFFPNRDRVGWHVFGGTSAASPQVAGLVALANQQQAAAGEQPIGFLNPLIYGVGATPYRDIVPQTFGTAVSGQLVNNQLFSYNGDGVDVTPGPVPGLPVTGGWDETTGYGSPDGANWVAAIRAARNAP